MHARIYFSLAILLIFAGLLGGTAKADPFADYALAQKLVKEGSYLQAIPVVERLRDYCEHRLGPAHEYTIAATQSEGILYGMLGDDAKAEPLLRAALEQQEKKHDDKNMIYTVLALGQVDMYLGHYDEAEKLLSQYWQAQLKDKGPTSVEAAGGYALLGMLYGEYMDRLPRAQSMNEKALALRQKALGPNDALVADSTLALAGLAAANGDATKAETLFKQALAIEESSLGRENPATLASVVSLGDFYLKKGDYIAGQAQFERALKSHERVSGVDSHEVALDCVALGAVQASRGQWAAAAPYYERAEKIEEKLSGADADSVFLLLCRLGEVYQGMGDAARASASYDRALAMNGSAHPQRARALYHAALLDLDANAKDKAATLAQQASVAEETTVAKDLADPLGHTEAVLLERSLNPYTLYAALGDARGVAQAALRHKGALLGTAAGNAPPFSVSLSDVQAALPADAALAEVVAFPAYQGKGQWQPQYGCAVISRSAVAWVALGEAAGIDDYVASYLQAVRRTPQQSNLSAVLTAASRTVWAPLEKALPAGTKTLILSPDGDLALLPFATLLSADSKFVAQKYNIHYVASGRDLVGPPPATAAGWKLETLSGTGLTKDALHQLKGPQALSVGAAVALQPAVVAAGAGAEQLAAWRDDIDYPPVRPLGKIVETTLVPTVRTWPLFVSATGAGHSPLGRAALVLKSDDPAVAAWKLGTSPASDTDAMVTAGEVATLDLKGTALVTLGSVDAAAGQGVALLALRRGFQAAGASHLLLALWNPPAQADAFVAEVCAAAAKSGDASAALSEVQRRWLVKLRTEKGLPYAVMVAGPWVMN